MSRCTGAFSFLLSATVLAGPPARIDQMAWLAGQWRGEGTPTDRIDAFVDRGGGLARFGGNFLWQVRLSGEGHTQFCYRSPQRDPESRHMPLARSGMSSLAAGEDAAVVRRESAAFGGPIRWGR